jgi:sec-independent protein translocase protein TatA
MQLGPLEIAFVLGIVLLLFGPDKIPQLAKSLGKATREYQKALRGVNESGKSVISEFNAEATNEEASDSNQSDEQQIIDNAKKLGIQTEGKTQDQLIDEILKATDKE